MGQLTLATGGGRDKSITAVMDLIQEGLAACPDSLGLHYTLAYCQRLMGLMDQAEQTFSLVTAGNLRLRPDDPISGRLGRFNSWYWISDARIRQRCATFMDLLATPEDVMVAHAWASRADMALQRGRNMPSPNQKPEAIADFTRAASFAEKALDIFPQCDGAQEVYLTAAFELAARGDTTWGNIALNSFEAACFNDYTILSNFGMVAARLYMAGQRFAEAREVLEKMHKYVQRIIV
jgi:tetratricopeptide (TPR) repeat protein